MAPRRSPATRLIAARIVAAASRRELRLDEKDFAAQR
jgi:hypothetical protein